MKLVEILARELEVWPEFRTRFGQLSNGELIADGIDCTLRATLAEDWEAACVTRPQWQAERDRMKAMEKEPNVWQQAIDHELVVAHLGVAGDVPHAEAVAKLNSLIDWHVQVATDPATNGGFTLTREPTYEQQLWDKVASEIFIRACDESIATYKQEEVDYVSVRAAGYADAFMAERAKRLRK